MSLTVAERQEMTYLNMLAFDNALLNSQKAGTRIPCFLCTSAEVKAGYRRDVLSILNTHAVPIIPFNDGGDIDTVEKFIKKMPTMPALMERWIDAETRLKEEREKNNPSAFFV